MTYELVRRKPDDASFEVLEESAEDFTDETEPDEDSNCLYLDEFVEYKDSWVNADFNKGQVERRLEKFGCKNGSDNFIVRFAWNFPVPASADLLRSTLINGAALFIKPLKVFNKVILDDRNKLAVRGIMYCLDTLGMDNVLAIWGAAHLPGIDKILKSKGFKEERKFWHTAVHIK